MHYPLHVTALLASLLILQDVAGAAKNGFNADVLTSFAKNVASVLSTTLLGDYQDQPAFSHQSSPVLLKRIQETSNPEEPKANFSRYSRYAPSSQDQPAFQDVDTTDTHNYPKYYEPYRYPINPSVQLSPQKLNVQPPKNIYTDTRSNSIDGDLKTLPFNYPDRQSERNRYIDLQSYYQQIQSQISNGQLSKEIGDSNENQARITRRPFNLNYPPPYPGSYHSVPLPGFYPDNRQPSSDEPVAGQDESNSRVVEDQNQGQTALGYGYDGPHFNYRPPYPDGFYHGYPGFYPRPFNDSFNPGNGTGPYPLGPPIYPDPKFPPYFPYQPYPVYNGDGRPGQNGNQEQVAAQQNQPDVNATQYYPYGFPPYGYPFPGYPLPPFHGYNFGYGFPSYLIPKAKVPYFNFYPGPYNYFPFGYPYSPYRPATPEKPADTEKTGEQANGEAEMLSASKSEMLRAMLQRHEKRSPDSAVKGSDKGNEEGLK